MKDNYKADVSHTDEFNRMYQEMVKQAEECQQRMLAANDKYSWEYGYNHGAKDSVIMIVNSINEILKDGDN